PRRASDGARSTTPPGVPRRHGAPRGATPPTSALPVPRGGTGVAWLRLRRGPRRGGRCRGTGRRRLLPWAPGAGGGVPVVGGLQAAPEGLRDAPLHGDGRQDVLVLPAGRGQGAQDRPRGAVAGLQVAGDALDELPVVAPGVVPGALQLRQQD